MIVGGVELTPESSLKKLKQARKLLGVRVAGSKQLLWQPEIQADQSQLMSQQKREHCMS